MTISIKTLLSSSVLAVSLSMFSAAVAAPVTTAMSPVTPVADARHVLVIGDWGRDGQRGQAETAERLAAAARRLDAEFVISTGDNFYPAGVASTADPRWRTSFEDIYRDAALQVPWHAVLGNHDYAGNPQAEVDYTQVSRRWQMPARWHTKTVDAGKGSGAQVQFFFIDTTALIGEYRLQPWKYDLAGQDTDAQLRWLDAALRKSTARWKLVVGHHPIYTVGKRKKQAGGGVEEDLEQRLLPLLERYRVQAYVAGHEHDLQVIRRPGSRLTHLVSGAGSETRPLGVPDARDGRLFAVSSSGFMALALTPEALHVEVVDADNRVPYRITLTP